MNTHATEPFPRSVSRKQADHRHQKSTVRRMARKRAFDIVVASLLLIAAIPMFLLVALAIKLDSRGPVFYRVRRIGHRGQLFYMTKFRKMRVDAAGGPLTTSDDSRFTRIGALLTKSKLDELPQLWDVVRGRMSIVGPRPEDPGFVAMRAGEYEQILRVRPGITGITQLAFAEEVNILDPEDPVAHYVGAILPQKVSLDMMYVDQARIAFDLRVLSWTVVATILRRPVSVDRTTAQMRIRRRPQEAIERSASIQEAPAFSSSTS